jgi:hypothetical protein
MVMEQMPHLVRRCQVTRLFAFLVNGISEFREFLQNGTGAGDAITDNSNMKDRISKMIGTVLVIGESLKDHASAIFIVVTQSKMQGRVTMNIWIHVRMGASWL